MDHLSSADLDTPSKTPLFLGIAAVVLALLSLFLGWKGFSKANELDAQLAEIGTSNESIDALQTQLDEQAKQLEGVIGGFQKMREEVNKALGGIQSDISTNKKNIRGVTIVAGKAQKSVKELEAKVARFASRPVVEQEEAPTPVVKPTKENPVDDARDITAAPKISEPLVERKPKGESKTQTYRIKGGDYLSRVAAKFEVSLDDILAANPGIDPDRLAIGQEIVIPVK